MTFRQALLFARDLFRQRGYETPFLDAMVLLSECTGLDKARILSLYSDEVPKGAEECFHEAVHRRLSGLPVSYILRRKEFFGLTFYVDHRVLVPRPETEVMVETALHLIHEDTSLKRIHDACTGTGCIPLSLAVHLADEIPKRGIELSASDLSEEALEVFRINCLRILGYPLPHWKSDLLADVPGPLDVITANPPYIPKEEVEAMLAKGWPEPRMALDGGEEGLALVRVLARQAMERLRENGYFLVEGSPSQIESIVALLTSYGYTSVEVKRDLGGKERLVLGRKG